MKNHQDGFTLIELLVSVAVMGLVLVASTGLFFISLKAKKKNESLTTIKQSGNYALSIMSNMIRNAKTLSCALPNQITITNPDGQTSTFTCEGTISPFNCSSTVSSERIASYSASAPRNDCLTAGNIALSACSFSCSESSGEPSIVTINFTLSKGSPSDILGYASQTFKTTVSLRNY